MIVFWMVATALLAAALAFVLLPLLRGRGARPAHAPREAVNASVYRDQLRELDAELAAGNLDRARYDEAVRELEARVLQDTEAPGATPGAVAVSAARSPRAALAIGLAGPVLAIAVYMATGAPGILSLPWDPARGPDAQHVEAMVSELAGRLAADPENATGWALLARSYTALGRYGEASLAYANAAARIKDDAQLLADYADALAMAQGRRLEGEPEKLVKAALAIDSDNVKARALAGTIAIERRDYKSAVAHWEHILRVAPDSQFAQAVRDGIAEAKAMAAQSPAAVAPGGDAGAEAAASTRPAAAKAAGAISGTVRLAPELAKAVSPADTLFVFARAAEGPRMPVAILRAQAKDLPLQFTLDDRSSMVPGVKLSDQRQVVVGARISKSGSAMPQPGDVQGYSKPVAPGVRDLQIVLSEIAK